DPLTTHHVAANSDIKTTHSFVGITTLIFNDLGLGIGDFANSYTGESLICPSVATGAFLELESDPSTLRELGVSSCTINTECTLITSILQLAKYVGIARLCNSGI